MSSMRLTPMKTRGVTTETAPVIPQLVETNSMTTGLGAARNAEQANGLCVLSGALARQVMELLKGVIGSAVATAVPGRQTEAARRAGPITLGSEVDRIPFPLWPLRAIWKPGRPYAVGRPD